ncbi:DNA polymerase III subunit gamma/tau [Niveibacterium sp. COAC-50]|uniref:DNA polymerase III subunit gamma/tau n=1 Tax=Niveibacterium sp. COAC-50 TaxID=2729384 RepID=UPI0015530B37|nr:DNA polymerase III subunit gamma/tau [Niveibacterium sp. COAC-50]
MSYLVLARKWRPKSFDTLVGQEHVVRALTHALATGRLHHAWLFTGTRGVGKTTISRILAKALNCETGVTATPCGVCSACQEIDAGRFVDYVEMDAASNRGVDDMASLLDKAAYAPTRGRYKVYMIDEVHQLTGHAFNAMLKTLEEPPAHMKFILATTDPQKIPVTVLSRCLQFNLKQMPPGHIVDHLSRILEQENVPFEAGALRHLARGANGSMRDALSLLDQAIAHGAGRVEEQGVRDMLGSVGEDQLYALVEGLAAQDLPAMLAVADEMQARSLSFEAALQAFASLLHRLALTQFAPQAIMDLQERAQLEALAARFDPEFLQLAYQIAIHGRDDLALAPDPYAGFTMTLLRLHAFRPEMPGDVRGAQGGAPSGGGAPRARPMPAAPQVATTAPQTQAAPAAAPRAQAPVAVSTPREPAPDPEPEPAAPAPTVAAPQSEPPFDPGFDDRYEPVLEPDFEPPFDPPYVQAEARTAAPAAREAAQKPAEVAPAVVEPASWNGALDDWHGMVAAMRLGGLVRELAQQCELLGFDGSLVRLRLPETHKHLAAMQSTRDKLQDALTGLLGRAARLGIEIGAVASETPAQRNQIEKQRRHADAVAALEADPFVREVIERFDATLVEASVKPL